MVALFSQSLPAQSELMDSAPNKEIAPLCPQLEAPTTALRGCWAGPERDCTGLLGSFLSAQSENSFRGERKDWLWRKGRLWSRDMMGVWKEDTAIP